MKHVHAYKHLLVSVACLFFLVSCDDPAPQKDVILGMLVSNKSCQDQSTYLVDIAILNAYKTGYTGYSDTITVGTTQFKRVIQLDTTRLESYLLRRLREYKPGDKISIIFTDRSRKLLPACLSPSPRTLETVVVDQFGQAGY
jgi:hypothetical protein